MWTWVAMIQAYPCIFAQDDPTDFGRMHALHGPEACVFFATTTVGTYEKTWTAEYMSPNADWRDSYMATWQNVPGRGWKVIKVHLPAVGVYLWILWILLWYLTGDWGKWWEAHHDHEEPWILAEGPCLMLTNRFEFMAHHTVRCYMSWSHSRAKWRLLCPQPFQYSRDSIEKSNSH